MNAVTADAERRDAPWQLPSRCPIIGIYEIGTDEKEDDVRVGQFSGNLPLPFLAGQNHPVVPRGDHSVSREKREVSIQFMSELLILMGIGKKERKSVPILGSRLGSAH